MSRCHTRGSIVDIVGARSHFLTFSFIFARFGRFGGFVSAVSLVSVVSFRSFRSFRWFRFGRFVSLFRVLAHAHPSGLKTPKCLQIRKKNLKNIICCQLCSFIYLFILFSIFCYR